jgi:competence protein ComEC
MEAYFVDVGQGTCNAILVGGRRAIIIDAGRRVSDLRKLLHRFQVAEIICLALSHLDADHAGGAPALLTEFRGRIGMVCYPNDHRIIETPFWQRLQGELRDKHLRPDQLVRLECELNPKTIWRSPNLQAELKLFSPTFGENQLAIHREDANATSGVLVLKVGDRRMVFPGDSTLDQWREIAKRRGVYLPCDIIAVPHHAGIIWPSHWDDARVRKELQWLYKEAVRPEHAVISIGTSNTDNHPRPEVIETLRDLGVKVLCTQITHRCSRQLENLRPGVLPLILPGRSSAKMVLTSSGNSRDLACAVTLAADISPVAVSIRRLARHQKMVDALQVPVGPSPLCRP